MATSKNNILNNHRQLCPTCEGRTCIVCCSVEDSSACETIACPTCNGKGYLVDRRKFFLKLGIVIMCAVVLGNIIFFNWFYH